MQIFHKVNDLFWKFVSKYDFKDDHILQKVVHTFCVANHCFDASCRFNMNEEEKDQVRRKWGEACLESAQNELISGYDAEYELVEKEI
jgi:hypothetical protein